MRAVIAQRLRGQHPALEEAHGPRHPDTLRGLLALGRAVTNLGEHDEAHQHLRYVAQHSPRVFGAQHRDTAAALHALARCYAQRRQRRFAIRYYRRALEIREVVFEEFDELLETLIGPSRGEVLLRAEVARRERLLLAGHPETIFCKRLLARVLEFRLRKAPREMGKVPSAD